MHYPVRMYNTIYNWTRKKENSKLLHLFFFRRNFYQLGYLYLYIPCETSTR